MGLRHEGFEPLLTDEGFETQRKHAKLVFSNSVNNFGRRGGALSKLSRVIYWNWSGISLRYANYSMNWIHMRMVLKSNKKIYDQIDYEHTLYLHTQYGS